MLRNSFLSLLLLLALTPSLTSQTKLPLKVFRYSGIYGFVPFGPLGTEYHIYDVNGHKIESTTISDQNSSNNHARVFFQNNTAGLPLLETNYQQKKGQSTWHYTGERRKTYTSSGLLLTDSTFQLLPGLGLKLTFTQIRVYDAQERLVEFKYGQAFQNAPHSTTLKVDYVYDGNGNNIEETATSYSFDGTIQVVTILLRTYDNNQRIQTLVRTTESNGQVNKTKTDYLHGTLGNFSTELFTSTFDNQLGIYNMPTSKTTIIDSGHYKIETQQVLLAGLWQNTTQREDEFVFNRKSKTGVEYKWNTNSQNWDTTFLNVNTYSTFGDLMESTTYQDDVDGIMRLSFQEIFDYTQFISDPITEIVANPNTLTSQPGYIERLDLLAPNSSSTLKNHKKRTQTINANGHIISATNEYEDGRAWVSINNEYNTNQIDGKPLKVLFKQMNPITMAESIVGQYIYTYDTANRLTKREVRALDLISGNEETTELIEFAYDQSGRLTESGIKHLTPGQILGGQKEVHTYDANNRISQTDRFSFENGAFAPVKRTVNTYTGNDLRVIVQTFQDWENGSWLAAVRRNTFVYSAQQTSLFSADLIQGDWKITSREIEDRDAQGNIIAKSQSIWDDLQQAWTETSKTIFEFDSKGRVSHEKVWTLNSGIYYLTTQREFVYPLTNQTSSLSEISWSAYPNPANETLIVQSDTKLDQIQLVNQFGDIIIQISNPADLPQTLPVTFLPNGMYYLNIQILKKNSTIPILIQHK